jgi:hypothetical protein
MRRMRRASVVVAAFALTATADLAIAAEPPRDTVPVPAVVAPVRPMIQGSRAAEFVGQDVTVEGRVTAIHESPLATVLGFSQNFAGFTASILAADRDKFPADLATRLRDRVVRVSGTVTTYRGKPEMALTDPSQLMLAPAPGPGSVAAAQPTPAVAATADGSAEEIRRALARIEARLDAFDTRLRTLEAAAEPADDVPAH